MGLAAVAALTLLKLAFGATIGYPTPFLMYFTAALVAAWYGGLLAGMATTVIAAVVGNVIFLSETLGFDTSAKAMTTTLVFALEGVALTVIAVRLQSARRLAAHAVAEMSSTLSRQTAAFASVGAGITVQDPEGRLTYANDMGARICGFESADEMLAAPPARIAERFALFHEDGTPLAMDDLPGRVAMREDRPSELLVNVQVRATGDERWSLVRANPVRDEQGVLRSVVNVFLDVTDQRRQGEALRVSQEWFATALRSIGDAVITTDSDGKVTFLNAVAEQVTGWTTELAACQPIATVFDIFDETSREAMTSPVTRVLREGGKVSPAGRTSLRRRDGTECAIDDTAAPIKTKAGKLAGVVLVFRDVSAERRKDMRKAFLMRATAELNSSLDYEKTLSTVARLAVPMIADWCAVDMRDGDAVKRLAIAHVDPAKVRLVEELEQKYPSDPQAASGVPQILRTGAPEMVERISPAMIEGSARDDAHLAMIQSLGLHSYIGVPIRQGERAIGAITLATAESKRTYDHDDLAFAVALGERAAVAIENASLYREAHRLRAEAEQANRSKDEFLALLGHELRNPLAPALSALEVIAMSSPGGLDPTHAVIARQLKHMARLVDDLLDVSRIARGRVELARDIIELEEIVAKAVEMTRPLLDERRHAVTLHLEPRLRVDADPIRLAQVITNLLHNAAKYTNPGGRIEIRSERDGDQAVLRIRDNGIGMAPDMLSRVFDLFAQESQALDRARGGLGIGLAIVKSLVLQHGGSVEAHSAGIGAGSELVVRLPLATQGEASAPVDRPRPDRPGIDDHAPILLVDDNVDALDMLSMLLEMLGYQTVRAHDGETALALARAARPAIALLDIGLPGMTGYELARRLREDPALTGLRLIAMTGYGQASDKEQSAAAGFDVHLVKPVTLEELRQAIDPRA
ncbi:MAG TPA: ATP-binding protein [Kofleriaceae bacterium]|nr:ATP-binding protein [Kofleriaceae bacterium]